MTAELYDESTSGTVGGADPRGVAGAGCSATDG